MDQTASLGWDSLPVRLTAASAPWWNFDSSNKTSILLNNVKKSERR